MQIFVRGLENIEALEVTKEGAIECVKQQISQKYGISGAEIALHNRVLIGELPSFELDITVLLLGGKVHGSLARAGKVKGQTPKVEKQEKEEDRSC